MASQGPGLPPWLCPGGGLAQNKSFFWGLRCEPLPGIIRVSGLWPISTDHTDCSAGGSSHMRHLLHLRVFSSCRGSRATWATSTCITLKSRPPTSPPLTQLSLVPVHSVLTTTLQQLSPPFHRCRNQGCSRAEQQSTQAQSWATVRVHGKYKGRWPEITLSWAPTWHQFLLPPDLSFLTCKPGIIFALH